MIEQSKKYWNNFDEEQRNKYAQKIFVHYRSVGFPFYPTDSEYRLKEFATLMNYDANNILDGNIYKQTMHGLALAWSYMPHSFDVSCNNKKTPMQVFNDDDLFMKAINKRLKMGDNISDAGIRKALRIYSGVQAVSNFRPTTATAIYDEFAGDGNVYDMSAGYGGRLLGAIKSERVKRYFGADPCANTYNGLQQLANDFGTNKKVVIANICSEDYYDPNAAYDLCFTSPPYFNTEQYSDEDTQSYKRYPKLACWMKHFLRKTIFNCHAMTKPNGFLIMNVKDSIIVPHFTRMVLKFATQAGYQYLISKKYALSNLKTFTKDMNQFIYEPIMIFRKQNGT